MPKSKATENSYAQWVAQNPHKPEAAEARIRDTGIPVWAIIGYLPAAQWDYELVAKDYELPIEAVKAAVAYYGEHRSAIDERLAANAAYSA